MNLRSNGLAAVPGRAGYHSNLRVRVRVRSPSASRAQKEMRLLSRPSVSKSGLAAKT